MSTVWEVINHLSHFLQHNNSSCEGMKGFLCSPKNIFRTPWREDLFQFFFSGINF